MRGPLYCIKQLLALKTIAAQVLFAVTRKVKFQHIIGVAILTLIVGVGDVAAQLTVTPTTWNIIGLDSNNVNVGPNKFPVGTRVCNTGASAVNNVTGTYIWTTTSTNFNLEGGSSVNVGSLNAGACTDIYFIVVLTRATATYDDTRGYRIDVTADGLGTFSTPTNRELYAEKLISQNRNDVLSVIGPTTVYLGGTYTYTLTGKTSNGGYEQLEAFLPFPASIFQVLSISTTYTDPAVGTTNNKFYADACGWDNVIGPTPPQGTYRSCVGPEQFPGGKAGGTLQTTYTVKIIGTGTSTMTPLIYDFSGSSYHYNSDFGDFTVMVNAQPSVYGYKSVRKTNPADSNPVQPGNTLTWTIHYVNIGSVGVNNFQIKDVLPANVSLAGVPTVTVNGSGTTAAALSAYTGVAPNTNLLQSGAFLGVNGRITVEIPVTILASAANTTLSNQTEGTGTELSSMMVKSDNVGTGSVTTLQGTTPPPAANSVPQTELPTIDPTTVPVLGPTLAVIKEYTGYRFPEGNLLRWQSSFETDNLGFRVYRQDDAVRREVAPNLIAGSALMAGAGTRLTAGNSYSWWDAGGSANSTYYIEDVDLNGATKLHGPIVLEAAGQELRDQIGSSPMLNELRPSSDGTGAIERQLAPKSLRGGNRPDPFTDAWTKQQELAAGDAIKIGVRQAGWYRLNGAQLQAAGLDTNTEASLLQLYVNGRQAPLAVRAVSGENRGPLGATGVVEFYGIPDDTRESNTATYWLVVGERPGLRIGAPVREAPRGGAGGKDAAPGTQTAALSFPYTVERKDRSIYVPSIHNGEPENFFGPIINGTATDHLLRVNKLAAGQSATLSVALQGASQYPHQVAVSINGAQVGVMDYTLTERGTATFTVAAGLLREGDNTVTLLALNPSDVSVTDYLRLTYQHRFEADENSLLFTSGNRQALRVGGFSNGNVRVFDLTDSGRYFEVAARSVADGSGFAVNINGHLNNRQLFAFTDEQILSPVSLEANEHSSWTRPDKVADFIIVAPKALRAAAAPLAALRQQQGLRTVVVTLEDIFDEWSGGAKDASALRNFLRYAKQSWSVGPNYVLLLGEASLDPRNYLGYGATDLLPTAFVDTSYLETASDEALVDFDGDDLGEMSIGRLPARTLAQAQAMVARSLNFVPNDGGALFVADRPDGYNFVGLNEEARSLLPANMAVTTVNREGQLDGELQTQVMAGLNAGPSLVQYAGHGSVETWTGGAILNSAAALSSTNGNRLPLVVTMTCLNGYMQDPRTDSLAEAFMKAPAGGAAAVWASSSLTIPTGQAQLNHAFIQALYTGSGARLGDAARNAKATTFDEQVRRTWILFGDPTARIR